MQRASGLEYVKLRKSDFDISSDCIKPCLLFTELFVAIAHDPFFHILGPLQSFGIGNFRQCEIIADRFLPDLSSRLWSYASPPKLPCAWFSNGLIPVWKDVFFPYTKQGAFGVVFYALGIYDLGSLSSLYT